ncbi:MAG TPA: amidoligase family protein [Arenicellales bacterium]|nr:amidoligase family protein [Arenicellales bacterium]
MTNLLPAITTNQAGQPRRVGVELEFAGLTPTVILDVITAVLGGNVHRDTRFEYSISDGALGEIVLELDAEYMKELARAAEDAESRSELERLTDDALAGAAQVVVPWEIVTDPIPMTRLMELEPLISALRRAGARGTRYSPWYAFGLHLNPEMPALDAATILSYVRSYTCLYDWLVVREQLDPSRKWFTPYIETFDSAYIDLILEDDYAPGIEALIDDYLQANPTRNKSLDMLPLFAHIDEDRVRAAVDDPRIKARPALHYRLPNCDIDREGWNLNLPWSHWLEVEDLAADPEKLQRACHAFRRELSRGPRLFKSRWVEQCESWLVRST